MEWIKTSDRLPDKSVDCITLIRDRHGDLWLNEDTFEKGKFKEADYFGYDVAYYLEIPKYPED